MPLSQGGWNTSWTNVTKWWHLQFPVKVSSSVLLFSDISVQFITPGNPVHTHTAPLGTFQWMHGVRKPDASTMIRPLTDSFVKKIPHFGACTHLWYLLENNETSPQWGFFQRSVKHTNTIYQVCTNTIYQVRLYKFKYNSKSVWKQSLCIRCIVAECFYSQKMNTIRWWNPWNDSSRVEISGFDNLHFVIYV